MTVRILLSTRTLQPMPTPPIKTSNDHDDYDSPWKDRLDRWHPRFLE
jgi:hypothetical protein